MKNAALWIIAGVLAAGAASGWSCQPASMSKEADPREATYLVENDRIALSRGRFETETTPDSAIHIVTTIVGEPQSGDLNGDQVPDAAVWLRRDAGGSGSFFYVAAALKLNRYYIGTNALLVGDRVQPRTIFILNGVLTVTYADRGPGNPMTAEPTMIRTKSFVVRDGRLVAISQESG